MLRENGQHKLNNVTTIIVETKGDIPSERAVQMET